MKSNKETKQLSPQELVEAYVFPHDLTPEEKKAADEELIRLRSERWKEMTPEQKLYANLLGLRFRMQDMAGARKISEPSDFSVALREYLEILHKNPAELANEIDIPSAELKKILEGVTEPGTPILYRLEKHSGKVIPALLWWKLLAKKWEYNIQKDQETRKKEGKHVKNELRFQSNAA